MRENYTTACTFVFPISKYAEPSHSLNKPNPVAILRISSALRPSERNPEMARSSL